MKLLVIDGNSIINRAFYGIRLLSTADGMYTNGIYGFLNILFREVEAEKPDGVVAAFDLRAPTFRHKMYTEYKAQRKGMPDELAVQMQPLKEVLRALGVTCLEKEGYEADDIIGTLAARCEESGDTCVIITGDKDDLQLVSSKTVCKLTVTRAGHNESKAYTPELFFEEYGFAPPLMVDLKALWGDTSDNIPGVKGVGEKTAGDLIRRFGGVDAIYESIDSPEIKDSVRKKLVEDKESAFLSRTLATIDRNVPLDMDISTFAGKEPDYAELLNLYTKLEFRAFADKIRDKAAKAPEVSEKALPEVEEEVIYSPFEAVYYIDGVDELFVELCENGDIRGYNGEKRFVLSHEALGEGFKAAAELVLTSYADKTVHDVKGLLAAAGLATADESGFVFDTMLAAYLINPAASSYGLAGLCAEYLNKSVSNENAVLLLPELKSVLYARLKELDMLKLYEDIEFPLAFVLRDMEFIGVKAEKEMLQEFGETLCKRMEELQTFIFDLAGQEFNPNSPKQLGEVLFDKLSLPHGKKNKNGNYKTDADTLDMLKGYPIVSALLEYRKLAKLKGTYAEGLCKVIDEKDGRIHTTFNQTVAVTGRISSAEPNMQNIPVRTELGREFRRMFSAGEGCVLVDADYSQIELRVLAHMADDENMIYAFNSGEDIHTMTASQVFDLPLSEVTPEIRGRAKAVNFGIVYGISAYSLSQDIGVSAAQAKSYIEAYFAKYSGVKAFLDKTVENAKENGFVTTAFNRRRRLPELKSSNFNMRAFGERAAMNTPIQGTAADIIKAAMVRVWRRLKAKGLKSRLVLQVHDELIIEAPLPERDIAACILKEEMEAAFEMRVPLVSDVGVGKSWYEAKK